MTDGRTGSATCTESGKAAGRFASHSPELVAQWEKQLATPYSELSEKKKESDREQIRKYLPVIAEALSNSGER